MLKQHLFSSRAARPPKQLSGGCAVLFGLPFLLIGLGIGWFLYFAAITTWWTARGWEEVPCWIENADMKSSRSNKGRRTYHVEAQYRYQFRGQTYHSEEVDLTSGSDNVGDFQERIYAQLRAYEGKPRPFRCFVNPTKPEQAVLFRELRWGLLLLMSIFPMVFPLVGSLVTIGGVLESRRLASEKKLALKHPDEPWRWKQEWSGDAIQASKNGLPFLLATAAWIGVVQLPLALAIVANGELSRAPLAALALLPSLLALIPLYFAYQRIKTRTALGKPSLWLKQTPIRPGHTLEGELRLSRVLSPRETFQARILCQRKITHRSGEGSSTIAETLWQHAETLSAGEARREITGVALPLGVEIPRGLPCAVIGDEGYMEHVWNLELTPGNGGKPAVLPLPVFATSEEAKLADTDTDYDIEAIAPDTEQLVERLNNRRVNAEFDSAGLPTQIDCPSGRFRGPGLFLLFFGLFWFGAFVFMTKQGAPLLFRIIWGITSPLIIGGGIFTLLHRRQIEFMNEELIITEHLGPFYSWHTSYSPRQIVQFTHDTHMQSGNQFYYSVRAETTFGKTKTLIDGITESITAETLAKRFDDWRRHGLGELA